MYRKVSILVVLIVVFGSVSIFSQTKTIPLDDCIKLALENNPDIRLSVEERKKKNCRV